ncbi:MAG TPA: sugar phosphate nucleotidyltransferase [Anaerolineae bacterium]
MEIGDWRVNLQSPISISLFMDIPVVIVCGGQGTRMRGSTSRKKELVEVGGRPILWHVMRIFSAHGFNRFVLALGYGADEIKRYFLEYEWMTRDLTLHLGESGNGQSPAHLRDRAIHPSWEVNLVYTGLYTEKAGRIRRVAHYLNGDRFFVAYGDDVSDVDLGALVRFHCAHGKQATITAVQVELQYGVVEADEDGLVSGFVERPQLPYWINGGFMLFERSVLDMMADGDDANLETQILPALAEQRQLMIYRHHGFWQSMNTMKDTLTLERIWQENPPWKVWED